MDDLKEEFDLQDIAETMDVEEFLNNTELVEEENSSIQLFPSSLNILPAPESFNFAVGPTVPFPMCEPKIETESFTENEPRFEVRHTVPAPMFEPKNEPDFSSASQKENKFEIRSQAMPLPMCEPKIEPESSSDKNEPRFEVSTTQTVPVPMFEPKNEPDFPSASEKENRFDIRSQTVPLPICRPKIELESSAENEPRFEVSRTHTVPVPMFEPKNEPDFPSASEKEKRFEIRSQAVPLPMYEPKIEPENSPPLTMPAPMCEPKLEPENTAEYEPRFEARPITVPAPMCIPKVEPDMIDCFITQPELAASYSLEPEEESTSIVLPEDIVSISDDETTLTPGPSDSQNSKRKRKSHSVASKKQAAGSRALSIPKACGVKGCSATSVSRGSDDLTVFGLPNDIDRRATWLKQIDRMDLISKPANAINICAKHFNKSDIIKTVKYKCLKTTAVPIHFLPSKKLNKSVQARLVMFDNCSQTDYTNMESKAVQTASGEPGMFKNNEIKKLISECKKRLRSIENGAHKTQIHAFNNWCDRFLPDSLAEIVKGQAILKSGNPGNRYDLASKALSLNLFYANIQAYDLLSKDLCLLQRISLKRLDVPVSTSYNEDIMTALKMKVDCMSEREKYCSVVVDLMKLRASLGYVINKDRITGLHEVNGCQSMEPAQYALVILARGLFVNWSQPIAFALLSETKRHLQVSEWIDMYLRKLLDIGLKIKSFVTTFKSDLLNEAQIRSVSADKPYFFVNDVKIYYFFDVPDLLKELRDTFLDYRFVFKKGNGPDGVAAITHITDLLQHDLKKKLRLVPKLTLKHLYPKDAAKNQVRYAAQLLSRSVATALEMRIDFHKVDEELGRDTVDFLLLMNNLFDTLNSSSLKGERFKRPFCGDKIQVELLQKSLDFFQTLQLFMGKRRKTLKPQFSERFQITIASVLLLFEDLKLEGHEYLFTRHLHLEVSKKFFKAIKTKVGMVVVPTSKHFLGLFRELYLAHILKPPSQRNCSRDLAKFLVELNETEDKLQDEDEDSTSNAKEIPLVDSQQFVLQSIKGTTALFTELKVSRENNVVDVCKILLKGCLKYHDKCDRLKNFVDSFNGAYSGDGTNDWEMQNLETISPVYFVSFVETMEKQFCEAYESLEMNSNVGMAAYERIKDIEFAPPCPCFPGNYLKGIFIRLRIFMIVNYNTDVYRKNNFNGKQVVIPKLTSIYA